MRRHTLLTITTTSPASASTVVATPTFQGLEQFDEIIVEASLLGATGGTLDVYLQRQIDTNVWADWVHFPQLAAAATVKNYHFVMDHVDTAPQVIGIGTDATPSVAMGANVCAGGHPGTQLRIVFVAGASTTAGASQTIYVTGQKIIQ